MPSSHTQRERTSQQRTSSSRAHRPFSEEEKKKRENLVPKILYPQHLPVSERVNDIAQAIHKHQVVIIAGETGSGKTTQLPKICLEIGRGINGLIGHTQPRRIAARSVAERISNELGTPLGETVGYQVRFTDTTSEKSLIKLMTDGILLAEIRSDPLLSHYDTLIIDEAHERSLNIDFLLGYLGTLLPKRPDLKLIITSATIDTERFAKHFSRLLNTEVPIIEVSGRTYPVEIRYRPLERYIEEGEHTKTTNIDYITGISDAVEELIHEGTGDILVFLASEAEIHETRHVLEGIYTASHAPIEIIPLYARLSANEQHRIFAHHTTRRIILSTNIAETSLTVPGIHYVIDAGTARISRYSQRTKVQRLPIEKISQASAMQRSGRCGRISEGIAIRLYSEEDFLTREEFTTPEIKRTSLASVILNMLFLGLGNIDTFPFLERPEHKAISAGIQLLTEIGALKKRGSHLKLTHIGRTLARLPIDPRFGRMMIEAQKHNCTGEIVVLVGALSIQDIRERPLESKDEADVMHARFTSNNSSDFLSLLMLWTYMRTQQSNLSNSAFRRMCKREFLNYNRWHEWRDIVGQLRSLLRDLNIHVRPLPHPQLNDISETPKNNTDTSSYIIDALHTDDTHTKKADDIHRSLLAGLLSQLGHFNEKTHDYVGARNSHFRIWPGSTLKNRTPSWIMCAELVETSASYGRTVCPIEPEWAEELGTHLTKKSYSEPYWSSRMGSALCKERVTLYGLPLVHDRPVLLTRVNTPQARELARELFIRHALVENQWKAHYSFMEVNAEGLTRAHAEEQKQRRYGIVPDNARIEAFFATRIPANITSEAHFHSWWKNEQHIHPHLLDFTDEFLFDNYSPLPNDFPNIWITSNNISIPLTYSYDTDSMHDGITAHIPSATLKDIPSACSFDWLVPGMRYELIYSYIRALPKRIRKHLVPAPDVARQICKVLESYDYPSFYNTQEREHNAVKARAITDDARVPQEALEKATSLEDLAMLMRQETSSTYTESSSPAQQKKYKKKTATDSPLSPIDTNKKNEEKSESFTSTEPCYGGHRPPLKEVFERAVADVAGIILTDQDWKDTHLPSHASMHLSLENQQGTPLHVAHTLEELHSYVTKEEKKSHTLAKKAVQQAFVKKETPTENTGTPQSTPPIITYQQERLCAAKVAEKLRLSTQRITTRWDAQTSMYLSASPYTSTEKLVSHIQHHAAWRILQKHLQENDLHSSLPEIIEVAQWGRDSFEDEVKKVSDMCADILRTYTEVEKKLNQNSSLSLLAVTADIKTHIASLVNDTFLTDITPQHLERIKVYLQADIHRIEKAAHNPHADEAPTWNVHQARALYDCVSRETLTSTHMRTYEDIRWMIEEFYISQYAQILKTTTKVSLKRIEKALRPLIKGNEP
ncbi:MAG: ATP-dependent RNA helicase HrpA [Actinomycetaceae bacterium]|nr:ATP-dependent RNA helicase HrpA [Actinomycetaceae bacterium]